MTAGDAGAPPVRIGVLGAARIVRQALLDPAGPLDGVDVTTVAARDEARAREYASKHSIRHVHGSYEELLADPAVDAVYIPLPASLHADWTIAAIDAGKHVLTEKPFTSNAPDAERVAERAATGDVVVMEAYHTHFHPLQERLREIIASGEIGEVRTARANFCVPIPPGGDIRWKAALGGGSLLDVGYYPVRQLTSLFGDPLSIEASALMRDGVDRRVDISLGFDGGVHGEVISSMWSRRLFEISLRIEGERGSIRVRNPIHPHMRGGIAVRSPRGRRFEPADRRSTYSYQLQAFRDAIRTDGRVDTDAAAAVANMHVLDRIYAAAGVSPRPGSPVH